MTVYLRAFQNIHYFAFSHKGVTACQTFFNHKHFHMRSASSWQTGHAAFLTCHCLKQHMSTASVVPAQSGRQAHERTAQRDVHNIARAKPAAAGSHSLQTAMSQLRSPDPQTHEMSSTEISAPSNPSGPHRDGSGQGPCITFQEDVHACRALRKVLQAAACTVS